MLCMQWLMVWAQKTEVTVDKNNLVIGEQVSYGVKVTLPGPGYRVLIQIPDSVPHFEILKRGELKVTDKGGHVAEQILSFTSFDSGSWVFPALPVIISNGDNQVNVTSPPVLFRIGYAPSDTTGLYDIRTVKSLPYSTMYWVYWIAGILLAVLLGLMAWWYLKRRGKKGDGGREELLPALQEALESYHRLENSKLSQKQFYTESAKIFRHFLGRKYNADVKSMTTGELMVWLNHRIPGGVQGANISGVLRLCDAVKYAKFQANEKENTETLSSFRYAIKWINERVVIM